MSGVKTIDLMRRAETGSLVGNGHRLQGRVAKARWHGPIRRSSHRPGWPERNRPGRAGWPRGVGQSQSTAVPAERSYRTEDGWIGVGRVGGVDDDLEAGDAVDGERDGFGDREVRRARRSRSSAASAVSGPTRLANWMATTSGEPGSSSMSKKPGAAIARLVQSSPTSNVTVGTNGCAPCNDRDGARLPGPGSSSIPHRQSMMDVGGGSRPFGGYVKALHTRRLGGWVSA